MRFTAFTASYGLIDANQFCARYKRNEWMARSKLKHRESIMWQRRYWEHQIQDEADYQRHVDYVHWNSMKHRIVDSVHEWPHSTFHRYVEKGVYPGYWAGIEVDVAVGAFGE